MRERRPLIRTPGADRDRALDRRVLNLERAGVEVDVELVLPEVIKRKKKQYRPRYSSGPNANLAGRTGFYVLTSDDPGGSASVGLALNSAGIWTQIFDVGAGSIPSINAGVLAKFGNSLWVFGVTTGFSAWRSDDGGFTWEGKLSSSYTVYNMGMSLDGTLWALVLSFPDLLVIKSTDDGDTWTTDLTLPGTFTPLGMAVDPQANDRLVIKGKKDPAIPGVTATFPHVYARTSSGWTNTVVETLPTDSGSGFGAFVDESASGGSFNNNATFVNGTAILVYHVFYEIGNNSEARMYRSSDLITWTPTLLTAVPNNTVADILQVNRDPFVWFSVVNSSNRSQCKMFMSRDSGVTVTAFNGPFVDGWAFSPWYDHSKDELWMLAADFFGHTSGLWSITGPDSGGVWVERTADLQTVLATAAYGPGDSGHGIAG